MLGAPRHFWIRPLELMKDPVLIGTMDDPLWKSSMFFFLQGWLHMMDYGETVFFWLFVFWPFS